MPELPEVETIRIQLHQYIVGHTVSSIQVNWSKIFPLGSELLIGAKILNIRRFGKVLVIDFDNEYSLVVHIKMTGQFIYRGPNLKIVPKLSPKIYGGVPGKHTHVVFKFKANNPHFAKASRGKQSLKTSDKQEAFLYYNDLRKFGWMKVVKTDEIKSIALLGAMGPEPLSTLTLSMFMKTLSSSLKPVKTVLMDQSKIGGIGNIYANDSLYLAGIYPGRKANSLSSAEMKKLFIAVEEVLRRGIKAGGASENTFVTPDGTEGSYQDIALIYAKKGERCSRCGTTIEKIVLGGRGTFICPTCQK